MKLRTPSTCRPTIPKSGASRNNYRLPAVALSLIGMLVFAVAAAAACTFVLKWGSEGVADGQFSTPRGIAVDSSGNVFVAEANGNRVQKFDADGNFVLKFGVPGEVQGGFVNASRVAVDSTGNIYVTDSHPDRNTRLVQKFNSIGTFQLAFGTKGGGDGQFFGAGGVATDSAGNVYVTDLGNHRIQKFSSTGTFQAKWGVNGTGDGQFNSPQGVAIDAADNVYVADTLNHRIQKFTSAGVFLAKWGTNGTGNGQFDSPQGVGTDNVGNIYVADSNNNRVQIFSSTGMFLETCGSSGAGDGQFSFPADVASNDAGTFFYVMDTLNARVQKFGTAVASPIANAGTDQTVECAGTLTAVHLDGSASTPGSGSINSHSWAEGATPLGTGAMLTVNLPKGSHTITLTVTDTGGGSDTDDIVVNIVDTTAPSIVCPSDIVVNLPMNSNATSMVVNYPAVTATDGCSSSVTVNSSPASGSVFSLGTTTVHATADDGNGHVASCDFTVTVLYNFAGFFQPVDNLPVFNSVQAGRAIPIKFSLSGNKGLGIFAPGSPASGPIACGSSDEPIAAEETVTAGNSSLSYSAGADQYIYIWKTEQAWAGTCRQLVVQLNDGSTHRANFKFK